jgi:RHS repeat-associated protein
MTGGSLPNGVTLKVTTDSNHRIVSIVYTQASSIVFSEALSYDSDGDVTGVDDPAGDNTYTYTVDGQLASDTVNGSIVSWTYDNAGNRTSETAASATTTYSHNGADQLTTAITGTATTTYTYDTRGNLISVSAPTGTSTYTYNGANHLTAITTPSGSWTDTVDDNGALLARTGTTNTTFLTDPLSGQVIQTGNTVTAIGAEPYAVSTAGSTSTIAEDALGSGRALIPATGSASITSYDAWGQLLTAAPGAGLPGFTGGLTQPDGSTRLGQRTLDPTTGRWTTSDPTGLREDDQQDGLYTYVQNNPLALTDVTGLLSQRQINAINSKINSLAAGASLVTRTTGSANSTAAQDVSDECFNNSYELIDSGNCGQITELENELNPNPYPNCSYGNLNACPYEINAQGQSTRGGQPSVSEASGSSNINSINAEEICESVPDATAACELQVNAAIVEYRIGTAYAPTSLGDAEANYFVNQAPDVLASIFSDLLSP